MKTKEETIVIIIVILCACASFIVGGLLIATSGSPAPSPSGSTPTGTPARSPGPSGTPSGPPTTCPAGEYLSGNSCVTCPAATYKKTSTTLQSDCLSVPDNAWPNRDQSDWGCQTNYSKNSAGTGCQLNSYKINTTYYPASYYDSSTAQNMTVSAAKTRLSSSQNDADPIIGFSCNSYTNTNNDPTTGCIDSSSGDCWFIRQSKLPLPYPQWPNTNGCTWIRSDINVIDP